MLLSLEHYPVLRFFVDFNLRVVGPHMTLRASGGQSSDAHGCGVPGVTKGASSNGSVVIWLSDAVALLVQKTGKLPQARPK